MDPPEPRPRHVLIRMLRTETLDDAERWTYALNLLGADEALVFGRLRSVPARRDYLGTHLLARVSLAEFVGDEPADIEIATGPAGRPVLVRPPGAPPVSFSISHADHLVVCAVAAGNPIGVDVESVRRIGPDHPSGASADGSPAEGSTAMGLRRHLRRRLMTWTLNEAIAKASGLGVRLPADRPAADLPVGSQELDGAAGPDASWHFTIRRVTSDHILAVVIRCGPDESPEFQFGAAVVPPHTSTDPERPDMRGSRPEPLGHAGL